MLIKYSGLVTDLMIEQKEKLDLELIKLINTASKRTGKHEGWRTVVGAAFERKAVEVW